MVTISSLIIFDIISKANENMEHLTNESLLILRDRTTVSGKKAVNTIIRALLTRVVSVDKSSVNIHQW